MNLLHLYLYMFEPSHVIVVIFNSNHKISAPQSSTIKFSAPKGWRHPFPVSAYPPDGCLLYPPFFAGLTSRPERWRGMPQMCTWKSENHRENAEAPNFRKKREVPNSQAFWIESIPTLKKIRVVFFFSSQHKPHWFLNQMCFQPFLSTSTCCGFSLWKTSSNHIGSWNPRRLGVFF